MIPFILLIIIGVVGGYFSEMLAKQEYCKFLEEEGELSPYFFTLFVIYTLCTSGFLALIVASIAKLGYL